MRWIIGIDEVGRGALAGPVVVAAAAMPFGLKLGTAELFKLKDSKKLNKEQREAWLNHCLGNSKIHFALARVYPRQIEKRNISKSANIAAERAYVKLSTIISLKNKKIFLDGGLFLGNQRKQKDSKTVIKGDEKIPVIAIASIAAKVHRDRFMTRLAKKYPAYGFEQHKGYGTRTHLRALKKHGAASVHRLTFLKKYPMMTQ